MSAEPIFHDDSTLPAPARAVFEFWFGKPGDAGYAMPREMWFRKDPALDRDIEQRFGVLIEQALRGELNSWSAQRQSALALILLLDQFTRNVFRDTPRAFAGDPQALVLARKMVSEQQDEALPSVLRGFVYLPFEHAEEVSAQTESVRLFTRLAAVAPQTQGMLDYAYAHQTIIERFGHFPHRNAILGRASTPEEIEFLKQPGSSF